MSMFNCKFDDSEKAIMQYWLDNNITQTIQNINPKENVLRFMDGPPFVSSENLHYGHVLVGMIKSVVQNFYRMNGYDVLNKIGFDCHGLPIEMKVNELLGLNTKEDVENFGIKRYNDKCKDIIDSYSGAWVPVFERMARFVDFKNEYKTKDINFMETCWWVFKQLWEKNLVYRGFKIMPYSTGCNTVLSNFEANGTDNYKEVIDPSVYVKFKIVGTVISETETYMIAWSTTPWTLPSNIILCVNSEMTYVLIKDIEKNEQYIVAKNLVENIYTLTKKQKKSGYKPYKIIKEFLGSVLDGIEYLPLFDCFKNCPNINKLYKVISADHVTEKSGTGIVHTAPAHGEDDFNICIQKDIINITEIENYTLINENGCFTTNFSDLSLAGLYFKKADDIIIRSLKEKQLLVKKEMYKHSYPFCWRTDTPLIYRPVSSIFVKVTSIKDDLIANNNKVNWIPSNIGSGRFHKWLKSTVDWCVSRSRFFGTPIPIWASDDYQEMICIGSIDDLVLKAGLDYRPTDLHRESIDHIKIVSSTGKILSRIPEIFDCWFESGSVPFGQLHYPFENSNAFSNQEYLSDFICEGLDQTRGWFYTLTVLSTAILNKPAFKNVICTGLVMADDGKKMSKRLNNFIPPIEAMDKYSSDSIRLYVTGSVAAKGEALKFSSTNVEIIKRKLYQYFNAYLFFNQHMTYYIKNSYTFNPECYKYSENIMDHWILARVGSLIQDIKDEMVKYQVWNITNKLTDFIEDFINWYVKFNRNIMKGKDVSREEQNQTLATMYHVMVGFAKLSAPFTPYFSEFMFQKLGENGSVHLQNYPKVEDYVIDPIILRKMKRMQQVSVIIRALRQGNNEFTSVKMPINKVIILSNNQEILDDVKSLESHFKIELNILNVEYDVKEKYVKYKIYPDIKKIGRKYKRLAKPICSLIESQPSNIAKNIYLGNQVKLILNVNGELVEITKDECSFSTELAIINNDKNMFSKTEGEIMVICDFDKTSDVITMFSCRSFITNVQDMRKGANLKPWDKIGIYYQCSDTTFNDILIKNKEHIVKDLDYGFQNIVHKNDNEVVVSEKHIEIDDVDVYLTITYLEN